MYKALEMYARAQTSSPLEKGSDDDASHVSFKSHDDEDAEVVVDAVTSQSSQFSSMLPQKQVVDVAS